VNGPPHSSIVSSRWLECGIVPRSSIYSYRLNNGDIYQIEGFTRQGVIKLTNDLVVPKDYGGLTHGYVVTSHASQGKTVDIPLVALGSELFAAAMLWRPDCCLHRSSLRSSEK